MASAGESPEIQQLLELLAVVASFDDEDAAVHAAAERAAQAMEAEVAAVVLDGEVAAAVGFPDGAVPRADLLSVARRERDWIEVPGLDKCRALVASWTGVRPGTLVIARWGDEPYTVEERHLVRGMARLLELSLTMLRALHTEQRLRRRADEQAVENARLLEELRGQQHLLVQLSLIQRAISRREPLEQILGTVTAAARDLIGDEIVGLWIADPQEPGRARLRASVGLDANDLPSMPLDEAGAAGAAMRRGELVVIYGEHDAPARVRDSADTRLYAAMAAPVHQDGRVVGGLLVASCRPGRRYAGREQDTLYSFAQNVSLALTDAHTFERMNRAAHDTLTGLAGRGLFMDELTAELGRAGCAALLFIDLDRVKPVNDTLGHPAGDELLRQAADRIGALIRPDDLAGRVGGDEFAVLLRDVTDQRMATDIAARIVRELARPMRVLGHPVQIGASVGVATAAADAPRLMDAPAAQDLLRRADIAMYQAKRNGRGRFEIYSPEMADGFTKVRLHG